MTMRWLRKPHREKVLIDTDWLLGPAPDVPRQRIQVSPRHGRAQPKGWARFLAIASVIGLTAVVAWKWEEASHQLMRWEWTRLLSSDSTTEETLEALVSLSDSIDDADALLLAQLQSHQGNRRTVAFQLLKNRIEQRFRKPMSVEKRRSIVSLLQSFDQQDKELMMMRGWLASRILASAPTDDAASRLEREALMAMIGDAAATDAEQPPIASISASIPVSISMNKTSVHSSKAIETDRNFAMPNLPPLPHTQIEIPAAPLSPETNLSAQNLSSGTNAPWGTNALRNPATDSRFGATIRLTDDALSGTVKDSSPSSDIAFQNRVEAKIHARDEAIVTPVSVASIKQEVSPKTQNVRTIEGSNRDSATGSMRGLGKLSMDQVMRLLESAQDRLVAQAVSELESRGMKPQHVELALELARGSSADRLAAMETLSSQPEINPVPWLVWMAESGDREVRMRAISMLGATADDEALRKLRLLKQREIDNRVVDQITQVLLAAGTERSRIR